MSTAQPIKIAILAMGGEGGGVLADWVVDMGEHNGHVAQTTSVPGVAQRTGATIYSVELFPQRHQCEHRHGAVGLGVPRREQLDVVDGGAGALRNAGHRRGLRDPPVLLAEIDDPVGQHAAALAAHREDRDLDHFSSPRPRSATPPA